VASVGTSAVGGVLVLVVWVGPTGAVTSISTPSQPSVAVELVLERESGLNFN
jgi:hypothetical protein